MKRWMTGQVAAALLLAIFAAGRLSSAAAEDENAEGGQSPAPVWGLEFSPDGNWLAAATGTAERGGPIVVWQVGTWNEQFVRFEDHGGADVTFSPDGQRLAYAAKGGFAALVDVTSREEIRRWKAHETRALSIAWSPDGKRLATSAAGGSIRLWNAETGELLKSIEAHQDGAYHVVFSPDGRRLLSGGRDGAAKVWNVETGNVEQTFSPSSSIVRRVRWSRDGRFLLTSRWDGHVRVRDAATGTLLAYFRGGNDCADLTGDNKLLASSGRQNEAHVFRVDLSPADERQDKLIRDLIAKFADDDYQLRESASREILEIGMPAAPILREFVESADAEFRIRARRLRRQVLSPEPSARLTGHAGDVEVVCFSPDARWIATGCRGGDVKLWDTDGFREQVTLHPPVRRPAE